MTTDDQLLGNVIQQTTNGLLKDKFSLACQNAALAFFIEHAAHIKELSPRSLIRVAETIRDHPADWRQVIRADFRSHPRDIVVPDCPVIAPARPVLVHRIVHGDFFDESACLPDASVDLVLTSPPYCMQRFKQFGGIPADQYSDWSVQWMALVKRFLKATGSVAIVIQPHIKDGVEADFHVRMRLALQEAGWNCIQTLVWQKLSSVPLGHPDRPRRSVEYIMWFSLTNKPFADPKAAGYFSHHIGIKKWKRHPRARFRWVPPPRSGMARMSDIISVPPARNDRTRGNDHPAMYSVELCAPLIRLLSEPGGIVVDPFSGAGTTIVAAKVLGRSGIGFERIGRYVNVARQRLNAAK